MRKQKFKETLIAYTIATLIVAGLVYVAISIEENKLFHKTQIHSR
jgi:hypothetical protein